MGGRRPRAHHRSSTRPAATLVRLRLGCQERPLAEFMERTEDNRLFYREYIEIGMYSKQIRVYLEKFGPENVLILLYEDLARDPRACIEEVFKHLGVDHQHPIDMKLHNAFSMPRSGLVRTLFQSGLAQQMGTRLPDKLKRAVKAVTHSQKRPDLSSDEPQLAKLFQQDIEAVSEIIGRDLSHWLPN